MMGIILVLIIGGLVGWIGARAVGRREGVIASIIIGIVGAIIGNTIARWLGTGGYFAFSWAGIFWALIGAIILSSILNLFQHRSTI